MTDPALVERITRLLAYMLRHQPEQFEIEVDSLGFAAVEDVLRALNERIGDPPVERADLEHAVAAGDRARYQIAGDRVRALYGHSIAIEPGEPGKPPDRLYLSLPARDVERARHAGLRGGRRRFLHLGLNEEDAREVGRRAAREYVIVCVHSREAWEDGVNFYDRSALWLVEELAPRWLEFGASYQDGEEPMRAGREDSREGGGRRFDRQHEQGGRRERSAESPRALPQAEPGAEGTPPEQLAPRFEQGAARSGEQRGPQARGEHGEMGAGGRRRRRGGRRRGQGPQTGEARHTGGSGLRPGYAEPAPVEDWGASEGDAPLPNTEQPVEQGFANQAPTAPHDPGARAAREGHRQGQGERAPGERTQAGGGFDAARQTPAAGRGWRDAPRGAEREAGRSGGPRAGFDQQRGGRSGRPDGARNQDRPREDRPREDARFPRHEERAPQAPNFASPPPAAAPLSQPVTREEHSFGLGIFEDNSPATHKPQLPPAKPAPSTPAPAPLPRAPQAEAEDTGPGFGAGI